MKKRIFTMFILAASMAMVACSSSSTVNEGATNGDNQALQILEKKREFYKAQDREKAKLEAEAKKAEENAKLEAARAQEEAKRIEEEAKKAEEDAKLQAAKAEEEARKAQEKAIEDAKKAEEQAKLEALKVLEKKRKTN